MAPELRPRAGSLRLGAHDNTAAGLSRADLCLTRQAPRLWLPFQLLKLSLKGRKNKEPIMNACMYVGNRVSAAAPIRRVQPLAVLSYNLCGMQVSCHVSCSNHVVAQ